MKRSWSSFYSPRRMILVGALTTCALFIYLMWFGMNSDQDNVPPLLTQLIPAGHCTCQSSASFECEECFSCLNSSSAPPEPEHQSVWKFQYGRDDRDLSLSAGQCQSSFPGLFQDIYRGVKYWTSQGGLTSQDLNKTPFEDGMARAIISDGELYIVAVKAKGPDHRRKILAILGSIHRVLAASSHHRVSFTTIEFIFSIEDRVDDVDAVGHPVWVLSRKVSEESVFLIPDFGFWSWANSHIGPYGQVVERVLAAEPRLSDKHKKLVWRGKLSFAPKLRRTLLDVARGTSWGDIRALDWSKKANFLTMEDHCRYMFIGHVEGRAYSASLKYRQACRSVIVAHKLQYMQHHYYLLVSSGPEQNYVEVERDFADLPSRMDELLLDQDKAERIADNNVKTFRERYLTQAAEACYWRTLWEEWAKVSLNVSRDVEPRPVGERGLRYESFILRDSEDMLAFSFTNNE
ncbi:hypothetical protein FE257_001084 [Aspergillus nanangensis]|uniref:Glycosyl transferase CAP10 domain-containing protein n=1 Tax=Aspergillus nanangensis TaxID=2582783 RepID=A0AAD4CVW5_ASPNN|nr:hypothetical protein FE257_001084 [Aspergillus nanangensis]